MRRSLFLQSPAQSSSPAAPSPEALSRLLYPAHRDLRARAFELLREPVFRLRYNETVAMERSRTTARIARVRQAGLLRDTVSRANEAGSRRYDVLIDVLALLDHSLEIRFGVNLGLFCATIRRLGSEEQYTHWLPRIEDGRDVGCFALTELGHGSNVRGIQTTARYLPDVQQFEIHTPHDLAQKFWIGAAAETANVAVVFAQLTVDAVHHGIHIFIVPLRNKHDMSLCDGITIADCGPKAGLNGVDNGRIWFDRVRVPRENMLSSMSSVSPDGRYSSSFTSPDARFGAQLAALTGGRVGIAFNAIEIALLGLTIAIRYSAKRRAFAPKKGAEEVPLLFYTSQQRLLMVPLATAFVYAFCARDLREMYYKSITTGSIGKDVHSLSAGYKAMFSWFMQDTLQKAREACGGQGYRSENRIAPIKADRDVMLTFEGANGVMLQQVAKVLLAELGAAAKNGGTYAKDSVVEALNTPPPPFPSGSCNSSKKLDQTFIYAALWKREDKLVKQLGERYGRMVRHWNGSAFQAWNDCLSVAEAAATAHMHRRMYDAHLVHVKHASVADAASGEALRLCGRVWAANTIASDESFLRLGCISAAQATDVVEQIDDLCKKMTSISEALLKGVGFPDHLLAPIAVDFVAHNARAKL
ncbi:acyl-CoA oxidase [Chondrus crispus]|uniref:Acyl-coenzyme A oxidase n=1 Tax=Chondrus crispus TaxID=2769 RepID=R7QMZ0_CHOCR|nr:acyl-CoA oxidase [Chondrus crispus]CDF38750.1 acyl-CoA oxidase [Chondrus crispus]|eukprot:XP_005718655.1 acyl-CoA oxidase [Chondrus crispus]